jgi:hypothetical protein
VEADRVDGRDPDRAADDLLHLLQLAQEFVVGMQDLLRRFIDPLPLARELELLLAAVDQQGLEVPLHRPGLLAHRRLRDAVQLGGFGKALRFDEVGEILKFSICMAIVVAAQHKGI